MARPASDIRSGILSAVEKQLRRVGAGGVTIESVAREAGCAKGLVHYHFKTKTGLLTAAAEQLLGDRVRRWAGVLQAPNAQAAIDQSWQLIVSEASTGFWRAWTSLAASPERVTVQTVSNGFERFAETLA